MTKLKNIDGVMLEKKYRNKDHDTMMSYLASDTAPSHAIYAWHYHSNRAANYIKKLELKFATLGEVSVTLDVEKMIDILTVKEDEGFNFPDHLYDMRHQIAQALKDHADEIIVKEEK